MNIETVITTALIVVCVFLAVMFLAALWGGR